jgi:pimeloyl-ACP methyl ester carboxylesterase
VVTGADDLVIDPKESQTLAQAIPGSEIHVIPDAGHLVAYEKAKEFNAILRDWVRIAAT